MWIERIRLDNFLGFGDCAVEFDRGLNVVYSPNEGGKSTILRAIVAALYGDAFSRSAETKALARWGSAELFRVELAITLGGERYLVIRDFQTKEQEIRVEGANAPEARGKFVSAFLGERLPLDDDLFLRVCAVRHEELASVGGGPVGIGERIEEILGGGTGDRSPVAVMRLVEEKRKELNRGRDGRANRENWGALRRLGEEADSLDLALSASREIASRRAELSKGIAAARTRLAGVEEDLSVLEERRGRAALLRDLDTAESETLRRSRALRERLDRVQTLVAERAAAGESIARLPAFLARCDAPALDALVADLERESALERELERPWSPVSRNPAWRLALGLCLAAVGIAGAVFWKTELVLAAAAGAAIVLWHFLRPRAAARAAREYAARELEGLRGKRAPWTESSSREEAGNLVLAMREARGRLAGIEARLEEASGAKDRCDEVVARLDRELGDLAIELIGLRERGRELEAFRVDPERMLLMEREMRNKSDEARSLRDEIARAEGQLSALPESDAAGIEERLAAAREDLARARRKARVLDIVADALGEARRRMSGTLAARLPALAAARLATLTAGRYASLFIDPLTLAIETAPAPADLAGGPGSAGGPSRVSPDALSQGARDQIYIAVRLALVDLLSGGESQPLFLDDPFVHFDPERRARAVDMLLDFARSHQVVLFTCDPAYRTIEARLVELRR